MTDKRHLRVVLPTENPPPELRYSMPDPDELRDAFDRVQYHCYRAEQIDVRIDACDLRQVLMLAETYLALANMGQEQAVSKIRDLHRVLRKRKAED